MITPITLISISHCANNINVWIRIERKWKRMKSTRAIREKYIEITMYECYENRWNKLGFAVLIFIIALFEICPSISLRVGNKNRPIALLDYHVNTSISCKNNNKR